MATMAAMIGAAGLGAPVWGGLGRLAFGDALEAGIALVLVAILLDRVSAVHVHRGEHHAPEGARQSRPDVRLGSAAVFAPFLLGTVIAHGCLPRTVAGLRRSAVGEGRLAPGPDRLAASSG